MHVTFRVHSISLIVAVLPLCCGCGSEARKRADEERFPSGITRSAAEKTAARVRVGFLRVALCRSALAMYDATIGSYPTTAQGLEALRSVPADLSDKTKWEGPYLEKLEVDPWGNPIRYVCPGVHNPDSYDVWSCGPDGKNATEDDIGNWESIE